jgi:hypothetical protein
MREVSRAAKEEVPLPAWINGVAQRSLAAAPRQGDYAFHLELVPASVDVRLELPAFFQLTYFQNSCIGSTG